MHNIIAQRRYSTTQVILVARQQLIQLKRGWISSILTKNTATDESYVKSASHRTRTSSICSTYFFTCFWYGKISIFHRIIDHFDLRITFKNDLWVLACIFFKLLVLELLTLEKKNCSEPFELQEKIHTEKIFFYKENASINLKFWITQKTHS